VARDFARVLGPQGRAWRCWIDWEPALRGRAETPLLGARTQLADRIDYVVFCQLIFAEQWAAVRARRGPLGIGIIATSRSSSPTTVADFVGPNQHLLKLDQDGQPIVRRRLPPDYSAPRVSFVGNPLSTGTPWRERAIAGGLRASSICLSRAPLRPTEDLDRTSRRAAWSIPTTARCLTSARALYTIVCTDAPI